MHAFDFVMTLMSFVYALAITHILATVGDMIRAGKRVRFSWLNAGWMLGTLFAIVQWWIGMWDLRGQTAWTMSSIGLFFVLASSLYVQARLVCAHIPPEGAVDLKAFHRQEGWKYTTAAAVTTLLSMLLTYLYSGTAEAWLAESATTWLFLACAIAATLFRNRWVQAVALIVSLTAWAWLFSTLQAPLT